VKWLWRTTDYSVIVGSVSHRYQALAPALRLAARQDGALTCAQALDAGLTDAQIRVLVRSGEWLRPFRGALLVPGAHPERGRVRAAILLRPGALACGVTAARLHRLDGLPMSSPDEPVHLLASAGASRTQPKSSSLVMHWGRVRPEEVAAVSGLRVTAVTRTLADLVLAGDRATAVGMLDAALHDGSIVGLAEVGHSVAGRPGATRAAAWLKLADGRAESPLETRLRLLLADAGLAPEALQWPVTVNGRIVARLDLAWPSRLVCVEADGAAVHSQPRALYRDRHRQNLLVAAGWIVLRFTGTDEAHPGDVVRAVATALRRERAA
jgi:very-short-patch-repair endonuclease